MDGWLDEQADGRKGERKGGRMGACPAQESMGAKYLLSKSKEGGRDGGNRYERGPPSVSGELS